MSEPLKIICLALTYSLIIGIASLVFPENKTLSVLAGLGKDTLLIGGTAYTYGKGRSQDSKSETNFKIDKTGG